MTSVLNYYTIEPVQLYFHNHIMATISQIAKAAGVSVGTVSNVLNNPSIVSVETRNHVLEVMEKYDYRPSSVARSLSTKRTRTFGLVVSNIHNPFTAQIVQGAVEAARSWGCGLLVVTVFPDGKDVLDQIKTLLQQWVDGIFLASQPLSDEVYASINVGKTPLVIMDHGKTLPRGVVGLIDFDWENAGYQATDHLIKLGHRKIYFVGGIPERSSSVKRENGYRKAMQDNNFDSSQDMCLVSDYTTDGGYHCVKSLLNRSDRPTGIVMANDMMALGAYQAAAELGYRIPIDFSVTGIDDNFFVEHLAPPLTSVHVPTRELGQLGIDILNEVDKESNLRHEILPTYLVVRKSTSKVV